MSVPTTIDDAYKFMNPGQPLERGSDDPRYVDCAAARGGEDVVQMIARSVRRSEAPDYCKQLFTGHRGCGKSTELYRLKRMLENQNYFVVYFDVDTELDIADLDYPDVLLTVAQQVEAQMRAAGMELKPELLENVARWFGTTIITDQQSRNVETTLETEYGLGLQLPFMVFAKMLAAFKGQIKNSGERRKEIRRELERKATELIQRVNDLVDNAQVRLQRGGKRGLVLIVDGLDRLIYRLYDDTGRSTHDVVFIDHGEQLRSPNCHLIFTFPINLPFDRNIGQIFPEYSVLPMVKINEQDGSPAETGRALLRSLIANRVDVRAVFDNPARVDELALMSGGHVRDLLRLIRYAFNYTDTTVSANEVQRSIQKLANEYDRLTPNSELAHLHEVHRTHQLPSDKSHALLLYNLLVLEYLDEDGKKWYDVHPAVQATRKFQEFQP